MIEQITNSVICWAILLLALVCYQQIWCQYFTRFDAIPTQNNDSMNHASISNNFAFTGILIGALPLLGLFGTIVGLLECFAGIASSGASSELMSSGIGKALLTTQLGLICAIPGWLLHSWVYSSLKHHNSQAMNTRPAYGEH